MTWTAAALVCRKRVVTVEREAGNVDIDTTFRDDVIFVSVYVVIVGGVGVTAVNAGVDAIDTKFGMHFGAEAVLRNSLAICQRDESAGGLSLLVTRVIQTEPFLGGSENRRNISNTDEYRKTRNIAIFATFFVTDRVRTAYLMCIYHTMQSQLYQCAVSMLHKFTHENSLFLVLNYW